MSGWQGGTGFESLGCGPRTGGADPGRGLDVDVTVNDVAEFEGQSRTWPIGRRMCGWRIY